MPAPAYTPALQAEYQRLFDTCIIKPEKYAEIDAAINSILVGQPRYIPLANTFKLPWYFIGVMHYMECNCSFLKHLHNGDPLTARTVQVPANRPLTGTPPFTWEVSADDALRMKRLQDWTDWTVPGMLYRLEGFNGYGYRNISAANGGPINSPYLWSYCNQYTKGKFVQDGVYDKNKVSKQVGTAVLIRRIFERQIATQTVDRLTQIKQLAAVVAYAPNRVVAKAEELQKLLNLNGSHLKADGKAGEFTSNAVKAITGKYLSGDPRGI